ncbi:MAG: hypothetical protein D8B59_00315, partial [Bacteroidetes bacterium]
WVWAKPKRRFCASHKNRNVGAILVLAPYSVFALLFMRQFTNCLYVVGDYRAAGIAVNMPINSYVGFERSLNIFANIAKE